MSGQRSLLLVIPKETTPTYTDLRYLAGITNSSGRLLHVGMPTIAALTPGEDFAVTIVDENLSPIPATPFDIVSANREGEIRCSLTVETEAGLRGFSDTEINILDSGPAWTFMVFINGDNNLEGAGIEDINEMEMAGSSEDVNILVQFDFFLFLLYEIQCLFDQF